VFADIVNERLKRVYRVKRSEFEQVYLQLQNFTFDQLMLKKEQDFIRWFCMRFYVLEYPDMLKDLKEYLPIVYNEKEEVIEKLIVSKQYRYWKLAKFQGITEKNIMNPSIKYNAFAMLIYRKIPFVMENEQRSFPYVKEPRNKGAYIWAINARTFERLGYEMDTFPPVIKGRNPYKLPKLIKDMYTSFREHCLILHSEPGNNCEYRSTDEGFVIHTFMIIVYSAFSSSVSSSFFPYDANTVNAAVIKKAFIHVKEQITMAACLARDSGLNWKEKKERKQHGKRKQSDDVDDIWKPKREIIAIVNDHKIHRVKNLVITYESYGHTISKNPHTYFLSTKTQLKKLFYTTLNKMGLWYRYEAIICSGGDDCSGFYLPIPLVYGYRSSRIDKEGHELVIEVMKNTDKDSESDLMLEFTMGLNKETFDLSTRTRPWNNFSDIVGHHYKHKTVLFDFFQMSGYLQHILVTLQEQYFSFFKSVYENDTYLKRNMKTLSSGISKLCMVEPMEE